MCTFVPGEVLAIGPIDLLAKLGSGLPGVVSPVGSLTTSEKGNLGVPNPFLNTGVVTLKTDPGLEIHAISRLSGKLAAAIDRGDAVVDVNHILPFGGVEDAEWAPLRMSHFAEREVASIRRAVRHSLPPSPTPRRVAVLDSGLSADYSGHRPIHFLDYSAAGGLNLDTPPADPVGHGTRVVSILDQILPAEVELSVGRLPSGTGSLTALTLTRAFADIVARETPEVVNLSVTARSDWFVCPACKKKVPAPTFLSTFLPHVIRLAGVSTKGTLTVMAAGNSGQIPNSRWLTEDITTLLIAVAENQEGNRARYSSAPEGPNADLFSAGAFGGDDPDEVNAQGVFLDGAHGTSFAAPFVSAAALACKQQALKPSKGVYRRESDVSSSIGELTRQLIENARRGVEASAPTMLNEGKSSGIPKR
jgi:hypothetical protein